MQFSIKLVGKVIFIGAGPGDPELITVKGLRLLQSADVILYDILAPIELLIHAKPDTECINVGKEYKGTSVPQIVTSEWIVNHALKGKTVVRLKGGDVSFFANITDELDACLANNIPFEIVPGVTAANGCAAYAGIPLTARDVAAGVRFLTLHQINLLSDSAWRELAQTSDTIVWYMSGNTLAEITTKLHAHGANNLPVAVIQKGTTSEQQIWISDIETISNQNVLPQFVSPSLVIVGEVVRLHHKYDWISKNIHREKNV